MEQKKYQIFVLKNSFSSKASLSMSQPKRWNNGSVCLSVACALIAHCVRSTIDLQPELNSLLPTSSTTDNVLGLHMRRPPSRGRVPKRQAHAWNGKRGFVVDVISGGPLCHDAEGEGAITRSLPLDLAWLPPSLPRFRIVARAVPSTVQRRHRVCT